VLAPRSEKISVPGGVVRITSTHDDGHYTLTDEVAKTAAIIAPEQYPALLKAEAALREKSARVFLLEKP